MELLDSAVFHHPPSLADRPRMAPELSRLYSPHPLDSNGLLDRPSPTSPTSDPTLTALAQLGVYRLGCDRSFVTLIDGHRRHVIAGATASLSLTDTQGGFHEDLFQAVESLRLELDGSKAVNTSNITINHTRLIIRDLAKEKRLWDRPFRFYAEVPLYTSSRDILGEYYIVDTKPHSVFEDNEIASLQEIAQLIAGHLEKVLTTRNQSKSERLVNALTTFIKSQTDLEDDESSNHAKKHPSSDISPTSLLPKRSSDLPDIQELPTPNKLSDPVLSISTRHHESAFFQPQAVEATTSPPEQHDASSEHSKRVSVADGASISRRMSLLFSRASALLQECMELDGVLFLDPTRSNSRSSSTASASDWETLSKSSDSSHSPSLSPSGGAWGDRLCEPLGYAFPRPSAEGKIGPSQTTLTEGLLHELFSTFPKGAIFNPGHSMEFNTQKNSRHQSTEREQSLHHAVTARLAHDFPEATSLLFLPLWNWNTSRWLTGTLIWTCDSQRQLGHDDLFYMKAFGDSIISEAAQVDWAATEKSKSDLISSVSHELRSPLHGMLASAELLQSTPLQPAQKDMVTMVETCGLTLLDTMNYLLDFTKINNLTSGLRNGESDKGTSLTNLKSEFNLGTLVEDVTDALYAGHRSLIGASKITGRYFPTESIVNKNRDIDASNSLGDLSVIVRIEDQDWKIRAVPGGWRRIVMNLLGNAFKFTKSGFIEISLSKKVERTDGTKTISAHLSVIDTGCGISREYLENKLFTPFSQENVLTEGVGLGLSIVHQLVTHVGGHIDIKSEVGVGTQVDVYIPVEFVQESVQGGHFGTNPLGNTPVTRACLVGFNAYLDFRKHSIGSFSVEAKRKTAIRSALSNVLLTQPGWTVSFTDSLNKTCHDIGVIEERRLSEIAKKGPIKTKFKTLIVLGEHGISIPVDTVVEGAEIIYIPQPLTPRKITQALSRVAKPQPEMHNWVIPIDKEEPFPTRGRSLSEAFALAKDTQSPPVVKQNVVEFRPPTPKQLEQLNIHVLIVDDNDINLKILATFMRKIGCSYETANNGLVALEKYRNTNRRYDYVLMDISMPIMDGIMCTCKIREYEEEHSLPRSAIMAVTGVASATMQQQAFAAGVDDYLVKPLSLHDLKRIMNIS